MIISLLELWEVTGNQEFFDFAEDFVSGQIAEDGTIAGYEPEKYRLDDVNEGRVLFTLYEKTGKEKVSAFMNDDQKTENENGEYYIKRGHDTTSLRVRCPIPFQV